MHMDFYFKSNLGFPPYAGELKIIITLLVWKKEGQLFWLQPYIPKAGKSEGLIVWKYKDKLTLTLILMHLWI